MSDTSKNGDFPMPPKQTAVETEAKSTLDMFSKVADGQGSLTQVFREIEKDRQAFGIGSAQEKAYTESVHWKLVKSNLLPEISLKYASNNYDSLSKDGYITGESFQRFRVATYKDMNSVEKAMNHFLMKNYDDLKNQTTPGYGTCVSMDDINQALEKAKAARTGKSSDAASDASQTQVTKASPKVHEMFAALTANDGDLTNKLMDASAGGITRESLKHAIDFDGHYTKFLNKTEVPVVRNMLDGFDEISGGDELITPLDLKYFGGKYGERTTGISRQAPIRTSQDPIKSFGNWEK